MNVISSIQDAKIWKTLVIREDDSIYEPKYIIC